MDDREFHSVIAHLRVAGTDNQSFEVKSCRKELTRDIGRTISGFANASGGTIICGLDENDDFKPVKGFDAARIQDALANYCGEKMRPPIRPIIETFILEGKPVLAAHIPELLPMQKPCYITASGCYGGSYIRVGDGDRRLSGYEIDRLIDEHEQPRYDDRIVREATLDDLDPDLVTGLLRRERSLHPSRLGTMDDETLLCKLHVAKADDHGLLHPTLAGLLALGTYPQEFYPCLVVIFTSYPGRIKAETLPGTRRFVDSFTCVGPIPDMIEDAVAAVTKNMRTGSRIQGTFRYDVPDYPAPAVREAIANALMHRDYSPNAQGTSVAVDLYADRLEIINPGGLYGTMTVSDLGEKHAAGSYRNQYLSNILESTPRALNHPTAPDGYVAERRGTGFFVINDEVRRAGKPDPEPYDSLTRFCLTFRNEWEPSDSRAFIVPESEGIRLPIQSADDESNIPKIAGTRPERLEYAIVELAAAQESVSMRELMEELKRSRPTIRKRVADLVERGVLAPTGAMNSPHVRYRLVNR